MIKARHVAIQVKDVDRSLAFYRDVLGLSYVRTRDTEAFHALDLSDGETNLTLLQSKGESPMPQRTSGTFGLDHIGFIVDNIDQVYDGLKRAGIKLLNEAPGDFFKVLDPDGVLVDIASVIRGW